MAEWQASMTAAEFARWVAYYRRHPFDDRHRYHRPAALVARSMSGADINDLLDWLHPPAAAEGLSEADLRTLKAFGIRPGDT